MNAHAMLPLALAITRERTEDLGKHDEELDEGQVEMNPAIGGLSREDTDGVRSRRQLRLLSTPEPSQHSMKAKLRSSATFEGTFDPCVVDVLVLMNLIRLFASAANVAVNVRKGL